MKVEKREIRTAILIIVPVFILAAIGLAVIMFIGRNGDTINDHVGNASTEAICAGASKADCEAKKAAANATRSSNRNSP